MPYLVVENAMDVAMPGLAAAALAFLFIGFLYTRLASFSTGADIGVPVLDELSLQVKSGAMQFLKTEYSFLCVFVVALAATLFALFFVTADTATALSISCSFIFGASLSAGAGWWGMMVATDGNAKTTAAAAGNKKTGKKGSLNAGLTVAFTTGAVMGFAVVGLGLAGASICYITLARLGSGFYSEVTMQCLAGFGFGASSIALFARVAGGIYTKAADVGADLVGKVEAGIDEDDPHNPAVIADNVGDNVGDVAGMGADLFESYVGSLIAAATLAVTQSKKEDNILTGNGPAAIALAFYLPAAGILCSVIGFFAVNTKEEGKGWNVQLGALMWALEKGMYLAGFIFVFLAYVGVVPYLGLDIQIWYCVVIGLFAGIVIGKFTEYFTSFDFGPVISIKDRGMTGPATVVIQGLGVGMISCVPPTLVLAVAIVSTSALGDAYGVAISAVGMLSTLGITLATDAYGPVADNAGGLAEMAFLGKDVRAITDSLDALGNTTAATGKGFAIGSAVLTALSLLSAFKDSIQIPGLERTFDVGHPIVLAGVLCGAMLPYLFAALTMISVGKAAAEIITEVRKQFQSHTNEYGFTLGQCIRLYTEMYEKHGEGNWKAPAEKEVVPDSDKCVLISTRSSVREMIAPGTYAVLAPLIGGFLIGPRFLMGLLAGAIASGCMLAIMMANAGGAWDNSKKLCEKLGLKKSTIAKEKEQQKACVVGDTVGDPFKDTSGPALNILIKLMSMVSLTVAPLLQKYGDAETGDQGDFMYWQAGVAPLAIFVVITLVLASKAVNILTWDDPLAEMVGEYTITHHSHSSSLRRQSRAAHMPRPLPPPTLVAVWLVVTVTSLVTAARAISSVDSIDARGSPYISTTTLGTMRLAFAILVVGLQAYCVLIHPGLRLELVYLPESKIISEYGGPPYLFLKGVSRLAPMTAQTWCLQGVYFSLAAAASFAPTVPREMGVALTALFSVVYPMSLLVSVVCSYILIPAAARKGRAAVAVFGLPTALLQHNANIAMASAELCLSHQRVVPSLLGLTTLWGVYYALFHWCFGYTTRVCMYFFLDVSLPPRRSVGFFLGLLALVLAFGVGGAALSHLATAASAVSAGGSIAVAAAVTFLSTRLRIPKGAEP